MSRKQATVYHSVSGDFEIVEATSPLEIWIEPDDIADGTPRDPMNCAIAEACRRRGALEAAIGSTVAYVIVPGPEKPVALKFEVPTATRRQIDRFDATGKAPAGPIRLKPLKPSQLKEKRLQKPRLKEPRYARATQKGPATRSLGLRSLKGITRVDTGS